MRDLDRAEAAARELLRALGVECHTHRDAPRAMAEAYAELLTPRPFCPTTFDNDGAYDELVLASSIPFTALCPTHLMPYRGVAHVGYIAGERVIGLSKIARAVDYAARRLHEQAQMAERIVRWLDHTLGPIGCGAVLEAERLCDDAPRSTTSRFRGVLRDDGSARREFLARCPIAGAALSVGAT
jgi:GTP cyclohydrolase I